MFSDFDQQMFGGGDVFESPFASQSRLGQQSQPSIGHEKSTGLSSSGSTPSKEDQGQERVIPLQGGGGGGVGKGGATSTSGATGGNGGSRALTTRPVGGGALGAWGGWPLSSTLPSLKMDLIEEKDRFLINADVPGFNKEQLKLNINNGMLTVSGETSTSKEEQDPDRKYHRVERSSGSIYRQLRLPENIKEDQISATCENGVLKLTLPKDKAKEEQRERSIKVQ